MQIVNMRNVDSIACMDIERTEREHHGIALGQWVRKRRALLRMTQADVAEAMGPEVDVGWVTQLENSQKKTMISQPWLAMLARALRSSEIELLAGAGVITEPLPEPGAPQPPFPIGDIRADIVNLMESPNIPNQTLLGIKLMLEGMIGSDKP
jgi:transcriptional regulator with XRE-family HTH domain